MHRKYNRAITQRCFLLVQGNAGALSLRLGQCEGRTKAGVKVGGINLEVSYSVLDSVAECIRPYRDQHCFRDWPATARTASKTRRGIIIEDKRKCGKLSEKQRRDIGKLAQVCPVMDRVDDLLFNKDFSLDFSCSDLSILLLEEQTAECFTNIKVGPKKLQVEKSNGRCVVASDGVSIETTRPFSFTSHFVRVRRFA